MKSKLIVVLAFILAAIVIVVINIIGNELIEFAIPGGLTPDGIPVTGPAQLLILSVAFTAGVSGAILVVFLAPIKPKIFAGIYLALILIADTAAAVVWWNEVPFWFTIAMVALAPLQVWVGMIIGLRLRNKQ